MAIMKAKLFPSLLILIFFSSSLLLTSTWPLTFGDETVGSTEYDTDCIAHVCEGANDIDLQNCKDNYAGYCEAVPDYKKQMSELAQRQLRCEEMRELQQCQSRCMRQHQQYQQCMQICKASVTIAARPTEVTELCREICLEEQGDGHYYLSLCYSNPDHDKGKVHLECMDRCKSSQEPQLCLRMCKGGKGSEKERIRSVKYRFDDFKGS